MIKFFKSWCENLIIVTIICVLIEILIPEGNNKKYVKVISGILIILVVLNPILLNLDKEIEFEEIFNINKKIETSTEVDNNIKDVFVQGIEENVKNEIIKMGYIVNFVKIKVDNKYENIRKIEIEVSKKEEKKITIKPVKISINESKEKSELMNIKQYINEKYKVRLEDILIIEK